MGQTVGVCVHVEFIQTLKFLRDLHFLMLELRNASQCGLCPCWFVSLMYGCLCSYIAPHQRTIQLFFHYKKGIGHLYIHEFLLHCEAVMFALTALQSFL